MPSLHESHWTRYTALPGLLLNTVVSCILIYTDATGQRYSGAMYTYATSNRASTQLIVQVLSHILGALLVLALTTTFNFTTRMRLGEKGVSLHRLSWWNQVCNQRLNFSLPWGFCLLLALFYGIGLAPSAFWAGALSPLISSAEQQSYIRIPAYPPDPEGLYWNKSQPSLSEYQAATANSSGLFSFYPAFPLGARILDTASAATAIQEGVTQNHSKYDNTRYSFSGRSYGVGSSVGLVGDVLTIPNLAQYSYIEAGYKADVSCITNETSQFRIRYIFSTGVEGIPISYLAIGPLPNSKYDPNTFDHGAINISFSATPEQVPLIGFYSTIEMVAMASVSSSGRNIFSIASFGSGAGYQQEGNFTKYWFLDKMQCEVTFTPRSFHVAVDPTERLINVTDIGEADATVPEILTQAATLEAGYLSQIFSTLLTSTVGDAFVANVQNAYSRAGVQNNNFSDPSINFSGVEEALESIIDDMLVSLSSAQLMLAPDGARSVSANTTVNAVQIGQADYIYSVALLNFAILVIFLAEALRTRGWRRLRKFNYNDLTSVIIASSIGGDGIGTRALGDKGVWYPDPLNQGVGDGQVQLDETVKGPALVDAGAGATATTRRSGSYGYGRHFSKSDSHSEDIPLV